MSFCLLKLYLNGINLYVSFYITSVFLFYSICYWSISRLIYVSLIHLQLLWSSLLFLYMFCIVFYHMITPLFLFYIKIFIFPIIAGLQCSVNFPLYSVVTQLHIHAYILFSLIIMLHCKWLDIVPSARQQDLIAYPFQRQ